MTKTHKINRTCCRNKLAYLTIEQATESARNIADNRHEQVVPYECDVCGYFHVGHPGKRRAKR